MKGISHIHLRRPKRQVWFLLLSILAHIWILWRRENDYPAHAPPSTPIEITRLPPGEIEKPTHPAEKKKEPEIAETEDSNNKELDPNAQFLSDRNQKADKETAASQVDDFRKKQGSGLKDSLSRQNVPPPTGDPLHRGKEEGIGDDKIARKDNKPAGVKRNWKSLTLRDLGLGGDGGPLSASDDRLDGVDRGERTVLSTREFRYFSYYHRIKETLRQYWKPNVERKLAILWGRGAKMKDAELVTQVLVLLDRGGTITQIRRVASSGFEDLDEAAVESFHQAAPFPNPPDGMIDPDGLVRIRWDFILKTEASPQISFRGSSPRNMPYGHHLGLDIPSRERPWFINAGSLCQDPQGTFTPCSAPMQGAQIKTGAGA